MIQPVEGKSCKQFVCLPLRTHCGCCMARWVEMRIFCSLDIFIKLVGWQTKCLTQQFCVRQFYAAAHSKSSCEFENGRTFDPTTCSTRLRYDNTFKMTNFLLNVFIFGGLLERLKSKFWFDHHDSTNVCRINTCKMTYYYMLEALIFGDFDLPHRHILPLQKLPKSKL